VIEPALQAAEMRRSAARPTTDLTAYDLYLRAAVEEIQRMLGLYTERYDGFTAKHFHEQLVKRHDYKLGYTVTRLALHGAGLTKPAPRRSAHRKKRPRRPLIGMMLHQDASRFAWLPGDEDGGVDVRHRI
jgi:Arc/MetJ family transcription regulator